MSIKRLLSINIAMGVILIMQVNGCSPEDKIKASFGDTSSWKMSDWQRQKNEIEARLYRIKDAPYIAWR